MLHRYGVKDLKACLGGKQIVFIGDSTMRQLFWAIARKIDSEKAYQAQHTSERHSNMLFQKDDLSVNFIWDPYLNSSVMYGHLASTSIAEQTSTLKSKSAIVVVGGGLWQARHLQGAAVKRFTQSISNLTKLLESKETSFKESASTLKLLVPVQIPYFDILPEEKRRHMNPSSVDAMNKYVQEVSSTKNVLIPFAFNEMSRDLVTAYDVSGLHVQEAVADRMADLILNIRCNAKLSRTQGYPMDKTCCSSYAKSSKTQINLITCTLSLAMSLVVVRFFKTLRLSLGNFSPSQTIGAIQILMWALCYCFFADRTQLWNKAQKEFDSQQLLVLCALPVVAGILTIRRSKGSTKSKDHQAQIDQPILSRDQTDEWKGWMQVVILAYHYTGASKILPIYQLIRLLVASYLFMTGFGHAVFYLRKPDYSLRRVASVLLRLNIMSVMLPYFMNTDYVFYYFAPLTTFWFLIIYLTMRLYKKDNHDFNFLLFKIFLSAWIVNMCIRSPLVFDWIFYALKKTCRIHWDVHEWRFRLQLDSYVVFVGMLCGGIFVKSTATPTDTPSRHAKEPLIHYLMKDQQQPKSSKLQQLMESHPGKLRILAIVLSLLVLSAYSTFANLSPDKFHYNRFIPLTSFLPILAFVTLRNATQTLRNYHSEAFAWIGRISLETFTLQFHVWLAADTKGLLRTGLFERWGGDTTEMLVLTVVFLWVCQKVSDATQRVTGFIVDPLGSREKGDGGGGMGGEEPILPEKEKLVPSQGKLGRVGSVVAMVMAYIGKDLRIRLAIIVLVLWGLNMVSAP